MSNGGEPVSGSPYIIICNGRIGDASTGDLTQRILSVSRCAADLASYMGQRFAPTFDVHDLHPISVIQHELMDHLTKKHVLKKAEINARIVQLFELFDALEDKYPES